MDEGGSMERLSLKRLRGGSLEGGNPFTGDPGRYAKKVSRYGHLSPWGLFPEKGNLVCGRGGGLIQQGL